MRLLLAALVAFWTPWVHAGEPAFDALSHLLHTYSGPVDEKAAEVAAPETDIPPGNGERLAKIQADLSLMAEGFETFRHPAHTNHALRNLPDHVVPELRPFFKDRDSTLDTLYRTLAVTDYTWALRFPEPTCNPRFHRNLLLSSADGLFTDAKNGGLSPWLARLLGPSAFGRTAEEALDRASNRQSLSGGEYELVRVKIARITDALKSDKAVGQERAKLYCLRAEGYETLAFAHRSSEGPIQAALGTRPIDAPEKESSSVLLIALAAGPGRFRAVGAGVMVETAHGPKVLTDSRLLPAEGEDRGYLLAFTRTKDGTLNGPHTFVVERSDQASGIMVGRVPEAEGIPALKISQGITARREFHRAIGHMSASGAWTVSQGLVTETANGTFASDAILGPDMVGGALLNGSGELVGLVVLSPGAGVPVAVNAEHLSRVANEAASPTQDLEFVASRQSGSASLLTTALPMAGEMNLPGGGAIESGLPNSLGGVNWSGGGGVGNWRPTRSAGRPGGYSSSGSSSYGSNSSAAAGAEIGQALGKAMAPLVEALIFKGIPMLFRGIGSLFKSRPAAHSSEQRREAAKSQPREVEKPPEPPKITGIKISVNRSTALEGEQVTATAELMFSDVSARKDRISVSFDIAPSSRVTIVDGLPGNARLTDTTGRARITYEVDARAKEREEPFDALKHEERRRAGETPLSQVHPNRRAKNDFDRIKGKMADRFQSLDDEETANSSEPSASAENPAPESPAESLIQAARHTGPTPAAMAVLYTLRLTAHASPNGRPTVIGAKLSDEDKVDIQSGRCPAESIAAFGLAPGDYYPGDPARPDIMESFDRSDCLKLLRLAREKCPMTSPECVKDKLIESNYYTKGCSEFENQEERRGKPSPGTPPSPNLQRPKARTPIICLPKGSSSKGFSLNKPVSKSENKEPASPEGRALLNATPTGSALKNDLFHRAADAMRAFAAWFGKHFSIVGQDGKRYTLTQMEGSLGRTSGCYDYITDFNGNLTHQCFTPGATASGTLNIP